MVSAFVASVFTILIFELSQTVKSAPTVTVGCGLMVTIIESETSPAHGAILVAVKVSVMSPVSFMPGLYVGVNVLIVEASIPPVP